MTRCAWLACGLFAFVLTTGCEDKAKKPGVANAPVKGTVSLDGKPLPDGEISFTVDGEAPVNIAIKDGAFSGNVIPGKSKVEIRAFKEGPPLSTDLEKKPTKINYLPDTYGFKSTLTADVPAAGSSDLKFEVSAAGGAAAPAPK